MKEKKPKSPVLVLATILFLAMFIALPPIFRALYPKGDEETKTEVNKYMLACEYISVSENMKITSRISYEDDVAIKNTLTYLKYEPTEEEKLANAENSRDLTAIQEVALFKAIEGIEVSENESQTVAIITRKSLELNPDKVELERYLPTFDMAQSALEAQGYSCIRNEY